MSEGPSARRGGWTDGIQFHELPFGLGNDFVFQHQDVAGDEFLFLMLQRGQKQGGERGSGKNLRVQRKRNDAQFWRAQSGVVLAILRVGSLSVVGCARSIG